MKQLKRILSNLMIVMSVFLSNFRIFPPEIINQFFDIEDFRNIFKPKM